ncbi:hypothetical protein Tco_1559809, partial [Tanacetum coccineum]
DEDTGTRIDPECHKENLKTVDEDNDVDDKVDEKKDDDDNDDDDNDDHNDHTLVKNKVMGSSEVRNEKM